MAKKRKFELIFAPEALDHLETIDLKHHSLLREVIKEQLTHNPEAETRNRKPLEQPAPFWIPKRDRFRSWRSV
jgi:hypothetical protein